MSKTFIKRARYGAAAGALVVIVATAMWMRRPGPAPHRFSAVLTNAAELVPQNAVRLNDVQVGKVESIGLEGLHAKIDFTVAHDVKLPADTRVEVRQTSLLGEMYLALVPAGEGKLEDGTSVPLERTRRVAELEQVVALGSHLVDQVTVDNLNRAIGAFDRASEGDPNKVGRFIDAMAGASSAFNRHRDALAATIEKVEQLAGSLAPHTAELAASIDRFADGMRALDAHRDKLGAFTTGLRQLSESAAEMLTANEAKLSQASTESRKLMGEIITNLNDFEKGLQALPDFTNGWRCAVAGHYIQFLAGVYPEVARLDTGGGRCPPPPGGPGEREEQGQVQVKGVPSQHIDDPAGTGNVDLGAGSANENRPAPNGGQTYGPASAGGAGDDGNLGFFVWSSAGRWPA